MLSRKRIHLCLHYIFVGVAVAYKEAVGNFPVTSYQSHSVAASPTTLQQFKHEALYPSGDVMWCKLATEGFSIDRKPLKRGLCRGSNLQSHRVQKEHSMILPC